MASVSLALFFLLAAPENEDFFLVSLLSRCLCAPFLPFFHCAILFICLAYLPLSHHFPSCCSFLSLAPLPFFIIFPHFFPPSISCLLFPLHPLPSVVFFFFLHSLFLSFLFNRPFLLLFSSSLPYLLSPISPVSSFSSPSFLLSYFALFAASIGVWCGGRGRRRGMGARGKGGMATGERD